MLGLRSLGSLLFHRCGGDVRGSVKSVLGLRSPGSLLFPRCGGDVRGGVVGCSATDRQVRYYSPGVGVT